MARCRLFASAVLAIGAWGVIAGSAQAATHVVHRGESIQKAVDRARPGDTVRLLPGVYRQNVTIMKRISLVGAGDGRHGSRLVAGATPVPSPCTNGTSVHGICVAGEFDQSGNAGAPVRGVTIRDLSVRGFGGFGVGMFNASRTTVARVAAIGNAWYGISGFVLHRVRFIDNLALANGEPGFYIGDSPRAKAIVTRNRAFRNGESSAMEGIGFLFRDSSRGKVWGNTARNNCAGMVFADTGENPVSTRHWMVRDNIASHNNLACEGEPGGVPGLSGIGIAMFGASDSLLTHNRTDNNRPAGASIFSGGIIVASSTMEGGADPTNDVVRHNHAHGNSPFDVLYDRTGSGNLFVANDCGASSPAWICS
jgi:hypothetical protein